MRILHLDSGREMRGGQWQALYLIEALAKLGEEASLLAPRSSPLYELAGRRGIPVAPLGAAGLAAAWRRADLVHAHDARSHTLAALLRCRPLVVARRVAFPVLGGVLSRWKYARATHFIAVSELAKGRLLDAGIEAARISVVYDGVPPAAHPAAGTRILAPATADPKKGRALVEQAAVRGGFPVHFSGNLGNDLSDAAIFLYLTHEEGLGSAALLAMAAGVPVVASRIGGLPEAVRDGETGLLVENTPEAIATAVKRLLADSELRQRMGACARRLVEERFSVDRMVAGTLAVYHRVLPC